jgi:hypothetical protein
MSMPVFVFMVVMVMIVAMLAMFVVMIAFVLCVIVIMVRGVIVRKYIFMLVMMPICSLRVALIVLHGPAPY